MKNVRKSRILTLLFAMSLSMSMLLNACGQGTSKETTTAEPKTTVAQTSAEPDTSAANDRITADREGNPITLPEKIEKIISIGPSNTEILSALGVSDKLIAVDKYSIGIEGVDDNLPTTDIMDSDPEQIVALEPDVVFVTGMAKAGGDDPYKPLKDAGICMIYIPSSSSIDSIREDIQYLADVMNVSEKAKDIISAMDAEIDAVKAIAATITEKKTVYFEISNPPYMMTLGSDTFIHEMIEIIGAENIFAKESGYVSIADEALVAANPDVILTSVNYIDDPIGDITGRAGWDVLTAVQNEDVYLIDANSSNRSSHNIVKALKEMARAVYPEEYAELK